MSHIDPEAKRIPGLAIKELEVDRVYIVNIDDCCVSGGFASRLKEVKIDKDDDQYGTIEFYNGVFLDTFWGCQIVEVKG